MTPARVIRVAVLTGLQEFSRWRVLLMPDHLAPTITRVHSVDPVPCLLVDAKKWDSGPKETEAGFSEERAASGQFVDDASKMIRKHTGM